MCNKQQPIPTWDDLEDPSDFAPTTTSSFEDRADAVQDRVEAAANMHVETCPKCRGTGKFYGRNGMAFGDCFACKGKGKKTYRTSSADREKSRAWFAARKQRNAEGNWDAFAAAHPEQAAWIAGNPNFEFAVSLGESVRKFGSLTEKQAAAVDRMIDKQKQRQAERQANQVDVDLTKINELFARQPKLTKKTSLRFGIKVTDPLPVGADEFPEDVCEAFIERHTRVAEVALKPAYAGGRNAGTIWVTVDGEFAGGIRDGKFSPKGKVEGLAELLQRVAADPDKEARFYGTETGICCCCGATLTNELSKELGIGPICRSKWF